MDEEVTSFLPSFRPRGTCSHSVIARESFFSPVSKKLKELFHKVKKPSEIGTTCEACRIFFFIYLCPGKKIYGATNRGHYDTYRPLPYK